MASDGRASRLHPSNTAFARRTHGRAGINSACTLATVPGALAYRHTLPLRTACAAFYAHLPHRMGYRSSAKGMPPFPVSWHFRNAPYRLRLVPLRDDVARCARYVAARCPSLLAPPGADGWRGNAPRTRRAADGELASSTCDLVP